MFSQINCELKQARVSYPQKQGKIQFLASNDSKNKLYGKTKIISVFN